MRNVALIGMSGAGKSTAGAEAAKRLGLRFVDLDALIAEMSQMTVAEIFAKEGERGFRIRETFAFKAAIRDGGAVIATGGGIVTRPINVMILRNSCCAVYLRADIDKILTNISTDKTNRPLLDGEPDKRAKIAALAAARTPLYESCADITVDADGTITEIVDKIIDKLNEVGIC